MSTKSERQSPGAARADIFGTDGSSVEHASPGTYGLNPRGFRLPAATRLGVVRLQVGDLDRSLAFYERVLGMAKLDRQGPRALLGAEPGGPGGAAGKGQPLVELSERRGATASRSRGRTGLFHIAILLPDRPALGRFLAHTGRLGIHLGASDHLVSESLYLHDPDGLGIEVYADRSRNEWQRIGRQLVMATEPLDSEGVLASGAGEPWRGMPAGTTVGHLHLHVGDLGKAAAFYSAALGLDQTVWDYPGALFMAAGGYHHHLGTNTWAGAGAQPPALDEAQLLHWTIELPDETSLDAATASLARAGFSSGQVGDGTTLGVATKDPWGTEVRLQVAGRDPARDSDAQPVTGATTRTAGPGGANP